MKKILFVLPILALAGCSSNTTAIDSSTVSTSNIAPAASMPAASAPAASALAASGANAAPTPFVADDANAVVSRGTTGDTALSNAANKQAAGGDPSAINGAAGGAPNGKMPQVPPGMSMGSSAALPATPALDKQITALEKGGDKKKLAGLLANRGTLRMNDANAAPRVKYRAALGDYRRALQFDPSNQEAQVNKKLIEGIYTSMGRPLPQ